MVASTSAAEKSRVVSQERKRRCRTFWSPAWSESVAVGLLWSVVNPDHELRVREILAAVLPGVPVTLSHEINPIPREYRRIIAAAIDASISPIIRTYVQSLQDALASAGFRGELLLANCLGGMMPPDEMMRRPIYSVMSGPTLAPIAALALTKERDVIVGDMGGTSFDVSALRDHQVIIAPDSKINNDSLGIPKVDVRSIGAGGGSIARVDSGGLLHVGPHSAGARPGPACYGAGGAEPTVTDANVVLGIIDPDTFLGGRIKAQSRLAETGGRSDRSGARRCAVKKPLTRSRPPVITIWLARSRRSPFARASIRVTASSCAAAEAPPAASRRWPTYLV